MISVKHLKQLNKVTCNVYGNTLVFHIRTAKTREILELDRLSSALNEDLKGDRGIDVQNFVEAAAYVANLVEKVEGLEEEWSELTEEQRLDVLESVHISDFWDIYAALTPKLKEEEKNE